MPQSRSRSRSPRRRSPSPARQKRARDEPEKKDAEQVTVASKIEEVKAAVLPPIDREKVRRHAHTHPQNIFSHSARVIIIRLVMFSRHALCCFVCSPLTGATDELKIMSGNCPTESFKSTLGKIKK